MKKEELKNVRGTTDYGGKDAMIRNYISKTLQEVFEKYGYSPLETSILCYYDLLTLKYENDNDIVKEIYNVSDQGKRNLALRYDLTVPFAKYIATNRGIKLPYKRFEIGKVFRDGPIKKGRTREFIQCDVDCVGIEGQMIEAELISIFVEGYKQLGIDIIIKYNNRKLMNGIIEVCKIDKEKISQVITIIDKFEKLSKQELEFEFNKINIEENQIENLYNYLKMDFNEISNMFKDSQNFNIREGIKELNELNQYIKALNLDGYVRFLSTLARGQEYYTGTVFEVYIADESIKSSIGGGGRYDNMIGDFINDGKKYPAVGISFGLDVIFEILKEKQEFNNNTQVYIIPMNNKTLALKVAEELRNNRINVDVEMSDSKLKKVLNNLDEKNIPIAIILGDNEIKENKIIIKDMKNSFQIYEKIDNYIETIKEMLSIGKFEYKILNPGGNQTALVNRCEYTANQKKLINDMIMKKYPFVEQVGFLSDKEKRLEMAGGEFCLNATRCAVYEYCKSKNEIIELSVSGVNKKIIGRVFDENKVEIKIDIKKYLKDLIEIKNDLAYVKIDGILIIIFDKEKSKKYIRSLKEDEEKAKKEIKQFMIDEINTEEKAIGILFLEKIEDKLKINPVVWVKDIDTVFYETACGSGSLGTAIYNCYKNKVNNATIIQPSGNSINIKLNIKENYIENAIISGIVEEVKDESKGNIKKIN